ncbi:MAG TPA: HAD hydrolase family protein [Candidatus Limnocylindrales bacterium]|nr:HAD hydrolase family protein [Candidatus Limnocylindrales bacterium]
MTRPLTRLVLADVDGCLTGGEGRSLDLEVLAEIAALNERSRSDPTVPAISLCTGRPAPYLELLAQAIASYQPSIFENGCGLLFMEPYGFRAHPSLSADVIAAFRTGLDTLDATFVGAGRATWQPGKTYSATLYPTDGDVHSLWSAARTALGDRFYVDEGVLCINVMPAGIDKGVGVDWLCAEVGITPAEVAGVGDSTADLAFLDKVGFSAAPANATAGLRAAVDYVSSEPEGRGVVDIVERIISANGRIAAG